MIPEGNPKMNEVARNMEFVNARIRPAENVKHQTLALEGLNGPNANIDKFHITRTFINLWIPFGDHPLKLERYRED